MKKNGSWKKKILYSVTAAALFVLLWVLFFPGDREYQRIPDDVVFVESIPLGATGKMLKTRLREQHADYVLPTTA